MIEIINYLYKYCSITYPYIIHLIACIHFGVFAISIINVMNSLIPTKQVMIIDNVVVIKVYSCQILTDKKDPLEHYLKRRLISSQ